MNNGADLPNLMGQMYSLRGKKTVDGTPREHGKGDIYCRPERVKHSAKVHLDIQPLVFGLTGSL